MPEQDVDWMLGPLPSGRHGLPREHVVRSQRVRLLRGAIDVAGEEGYATTTVSAVIKRAGVSRKTFYEQFADREDCFLAAYDLVVERAFEGLHRAFGGDGTWTERLCAALGWALAALAAHPAETRVAFVEVLSAGPRGLARRDEAFVRLTPLLAPGLDVAPRGAVVPASMPQAVTGALYELIGSQVRRGATAQLPELLPDLVFCALAPFVGPLEAAKAAAVGTVRRGRSRARA